MWRAECIQRLTSPAPSVQRHVRVGLCCRAHCTESRTAAKAILRICCWSESALTFVCADAHEGARTGCGDVAANDGIGGRRSHMIRQSID